MPRGRTRLTTPPGQEPAPAAGAGSDEEHYLPAFALPEEPAYATRYRWAYLTVAVLLVVAGIAYAVIQVTSASRTFDPSLQFPGQEQPSPASSPGG